MPTRRIRRRPKRERQHQALKLLASAPTGCTEPLLFAYGVTVETLIELIRNGLATAHGESVLAGGKTMEIARVRITEAGQRALAEAMREAQASRRSRSTRCRVAKNEPFSSWTSAGKRPRGRSVGEGHA